MDADRSPVAPPPAAPLSAPDHAHAHDHAYDHDHNHVDLGDGSYSFRSSYSYYSTDAGHAAAPPQSSEPRPTVEDRLGPTLEAAKREQTQYARRAKYAAMLVNVAMFAQVIISALITGLAASQGGKKIQFGVSALGALGTIIAGVLVLMRGTHEPERSAAHAQNLAQFVRALDAFVLDEGHSADRRWDPAVHAFRTEFFDLRTAAHQSENGPVTMVPREKPGVVARRAVAPKAGAGETEFEHDVKLPV